MNINVDLRRMANQLRHAGYMVVKIPPCTKDEPHGRHTLITRSVSCPGREPIPHGHVTSYLGSFGMRVTCLCGESFSDSPMDDDGPSDWEEHKAEHGVTP